MLANLYIRSGRFDDAIARLAPLLKNDPSSVPVRLLMGQAYLAKSDLSGAIGQFETVTRLNPELADGHYQLGRARLARGDRDGAKREYQRAAELAPDAKQVRIELAAVSGEKPDPQLLSSRIEELKASERALTSDYLTLLAQRARLLAERSGQRDFAPPAEFATLTGDSVGGCS